MVGYHQTPRRLRRSAVQSQQRLSQPGTVAHRQGPPVVAALNSNDDGGPPGPLGGPSATPAPYLDAKNPIVSGSGSFPETRSMSVTGGMNPSEQLQYRSLQQGSPPYANFAVASGVLPENTS